MFYPLFIYVDLCTEWTGYQGGEIEEATEGKEKQGQEDPWCKEGMENNYALRLKLIGPLSFWGCLPFSFWDLICIPNLTMENKLYH